MALTLTSVALVLLDQQDGDALLQLGPLVSTFLGPSPHLSLSEACAFASTSLLDWMWSLSCTSVGRRAKGWRLANYLRSEPHYYQWQFWKAMKVAAERGDLALLSWLFTHFSHCVVPVEVVEVAAKNGHLEVLQFLLERDAGRYCRHRHTAMPARDGEVAFQSIPEIADQGAGDDHVVHWGGFSIVDAVVHGKLEVARWLYMNAPHELNAEEIKTAILYSLKKGHLDFASFLLPPGKRLVDYPGTIHRPEVIEMELDAGILRESEKAAVGAILRLGGTGRLDLMQRIVRQHSPPPPPIEGGFDWGNNWFYATVAACRAGDLEMVKWLVRHPHGQQLCYGLMMGNGAEYVHWFAAAAEAGHVEVMKFLAEEDMDDQIPEALRRATAYGHLGAVKWLMERVPFGKPEHDVWILEVAVQYGRLDVAQYLHNLEVPTGTTILMDLAAEHGHLDILKWLHDVCDGRCSTKAMDSAATNGHFKVVKWLNEERSEGCTTDAMDGAAKNGHLEILKWLHHCRSEGCTPKAIVGAAEHSHVRVVEWLQVHYPDLTPPLQNLAIHPPNQFEMLLFLHETFPSTRRQDQPRFRLVHESNDEHVQAWLEQEYSSF